MVLCVRGRHWVGVGVCERERDQEVVKNCRSHGLPADSLSRLDLSLQISSEA